MTVSYMRTCAICALHISVKIEVLHTFKQENDKQGYEVPSGQMAQSSPNGPMWPKWPNVTQMAQSGPNGPKWPKWPRVAQIAQSGP